MSSNPPFRIQIRHEDQRQVLGAPLTPESTVSELIHAVSSSFGIPVDAIESLAVGFPPQLIGADAHASTLASVGVKSGVSAVVHLKAQPGTSAPAPAAGQHLPPGHGYARAPAPASAAAAAPAPATFAEALSSLSSLNGARKRVLDDNSCLFHAISIALDPSIATATYTSSAVAASQKRQPSSGAAAAVPTSAPFPVGFAGVPNTAASGSGKGLSLLNALEAAPPTLPARLRAVPPTAASLRAIVAAAVRRAAAAPAAQGGEGPPASALFDTGELGGSSGSEGGLPLSVALGEDPMRYAAGIGEGARWGGETELLLLARLYCVHIHAIDVESGADYAYPPGPAACAAAAAAAATADADSGECGIGMHCILLYTGLHYDVFVLQGKLGLGPAQGYRRVGSRSAPSVFSNMPAAAGSGGVDVSPFPGPSALAAPSDATASPAGAGSVLARDLDASFAAVLARAREVAASMRSAHEHTNTSTCTLRCDVCGSGLTGMKQAQEHAAATGHSAFSEIEAAGAR